MTLIGEVKRFTNIATDTTNNADFVRSVLYDTIRDTQAAFPWPELASFTTIATPDATFTDTTGYEFSYRFALPDDYLVPINEQLYDYRVIGPYVYADTSEDLPFHYQRYDETVTLWSSALYRAIVYRVAMSVCGSITLGDIAFKRIYAEYKDNVEPECYRIASVSREWPNQLQRGQGTLSQTRRGSL